MTSYIEPGTGVAAFRLPIPLTAMPLIGDLIERVYGTGETMLRPDGNQLFIIAPEKGFGPLRTGGKRPPRPSGDDGQVTKMAIEDEGVHFTVESGEAALHAFAEGMLGWLDLIGAANYAEMTLDAQGSKFALRIQKVDGKTPHQLRLDAEAERDSLRAEVEALRAENARLRGA